MIAVPLNRTLPPRSHSGSAAPSSHAVCSGDPVLADSQPSTSSAYAIPMTSPSSCFQCSAFLSTASQSASRPGIWKSAKPHTAYR